MKAISVFSILAIAFLFLAMTVLAQDRDTQEINRYVLTEAAFAKYMKATQKLQPLAGQLSAGDTDDEESSKSISELVARIDAVPEAKAAIKSAGISTREYVVLGLSLFQNGVAAWALDQPGGQLPPGVSRANVDFCKKHEASIQKLQALTKGDSNE